VIRAFCGPNGAGKTLMCTEKMAVPAWKRGQVVVANYTLTPERVGFDAALFRPLSSWRDISRIGVQCHACFDPHEPDEYAHRAWNEEAGGCEAARWSVTGNRPAVLLIDEISSAFPSRGSADMPAELQRMLHQFRKPKVMVGWTGVSFARADVILREATQYVSLSRGYFPDRFQRDERNKVLKDEDGRKLRSRDSWGANRLFRWRHFDAMDMEQFTLGEGANIKPLKSEWYWRPKHAGFLAYKTSDQVMLLDHVDQVGVCATCSGSRTRHKCACDKTPAPSGGGRRA
jgi:hypothetical protein